MNKNINTDRLHSECNKNYKSTTLQITECLQNSDIYPGETFFVKTTLQKRKFIMNEFLEVADFLKMGYVKFKDDRIYINKSNFQFIDCKRGYNTENIFYIE